MADHPSAAEKIDFDDGNESELARHGITALEAWDVLTGDSTWARNKRGRAGVWLAVGYTRGGRALTLPVAYDSTTLTARPITGWDSTSGERARYL